MRVVGIDLGSRRIGVAVSDPTGMLASPYAVLQRSRDREVDHAALAELIAEVGAEQAVVGVPYSLDGTIGPAATTVLNEIEELRATLGVPVDTTDERFTTVRAHEALKEKGMKAKARRGVVDKAAAAVLLQAWLDRQARTEQREQRG